MLRSITATTTADVTATHPETHAIRVHTAFAAAAPDPRRAAVLTDGDAEILTGRPLPSPMDPAHPRP